MQAVVFQQHCRRNGSPTFVADQLFGLAQGGLAIAMQADHQRAIFNPVGRGIGMGAAGQWQRLVEEGLGKGHHPGAAHRVVTFTCLGAVVVGNGIGAIQRVVQ
ncbi:hypothetical protein D3C76_1375620 [compost metagenome]